MGLLAREFELIYMREKTNWVRGGEFKKEGLNHINSGVETFCCLLFYFYRTAMTLYIQYLSLFLHKNKREIRRNLGLIAINKHSVKTSLHN